VVVLPAQKVTIKNGVQQRPVTFTVTAATENARLPAITEPHPGEEGIGDLVQSKRPFGIRGLAPWLALAILPIAALAIAAVYLRRRRVNM
jgi:hypothetical protein